MRLLEIFTVLAILLLALPAAAEEIVYFKNGQSMPVRSTQVVGGMVNVDLGDGAFLAFPESVIDRIEQADAGVQVPDYNGKGGGKVVNPYGPRNYPNPEDRELIEMDQSHASPIETDERTGLAQYRPQGNHPAPNRRTMAVTGNMRVLGNHPVERGGGSTFAGTTRVGARHVIGGTTPRRRPGEANPKVPEPASLTLNPGVGKGGGDTPRPSAKQRGGPTENGSDSP